MKSPISLIPGPVSACLVSGSVNAKIPAPDSGSFRHRHQRLFIISLWSGNLSGTPKKSVHPGPPLLFLSGLRPELSGRSLSKYAGFGAALNPGRHGALRRRHSRLPRYYWRYDRPFLLWLALSFRSDSGSSPQDSNAKN